MREKCPFCGSQLNIDSKPAKMVHSVGSHTIKEVISRRYVKCSNTQCDSSFYMDTLLHGELRQAMEQIPFQFKFSTN